MVRQLLENVLVENVELAMHGAFTPHPNGQKIPITVMDNMRGLDKTNAASLFVAVLGIAWDKRDGDGVVFHRINNGDRSLVTWARSGTVFKRGSRVGSVTLSAEATDFAHRLHV